LCPFISATRTNISARFLAAEKTGFLENDIAVGTPGSLLALM